MNDPGQQVRDTPRQQEFTAGEAPSMVTLDHVAVRLGDVDALAGVTTHVEEGCFLGLIGSNGAGKTTLLRTITDAVTPDSGSVSIDNVPVGDLSSREVSRRVAVVPQDASLSFDFDVREIVAMGRTPYIGRFSASQPADTDSVERAMKQTQIEQFASRSISEVSGGERQRVLLARAIAQETPVLLLDEPTASLDINHQVQTLELVSELGDRGKTVIAAIHDLNLAARYCDELLLLNDGRVMARGTPETVLTTQTVKRAFETPSIVGRHAITGSIDVTPFPDAPRRDAGERVHVVTTDGNGRELVFRLWADGIDVSVGPLPAGDVVAETTEHLGAETVIIDPFEPVDGKAIDEIERVFEEADFVVLVDIDLRAGMLEALIPARAAKRVILLEDRPLAERNHAGEAGQRLYESLRQRGVAMSPEAFLADIGGALAATNHSESSDQPSVDE